MINAFRENNGIRVILGRNEEITDDMEEVAAVIASFKNALYAEVPKEIADMTIATTGRLAYAFGDTEAIIEIMADFERFLSEGDRDRYGIDPMGVTGNDA